MEMEKNPYPLLRHFCDALTHLQDGSLKFANFSAPGPFQKELGHNRFSTLGSLCKAVLSPCTILYYLQVAHPNLVSWGKLDQAVYLNEMLAPLQLDISACSQLCTSLLRFLQKKVIKRIKTAYQTATLKQENCSE